MVPQATLNPMRVMKGPQVKPGGKRRWPRLDNASHQTICYRSLMTDEPKSKADKPAPEPKRRNRAVSVADALTGTLDPVLKKRGFASRDILANWAVIAPAPYDKVAIPDKLAWPRGERSAEGATLHLRCMPGHALAIAHEGPAIAAAINRYFGYVLVGQVKLSPSPFSPRSEAADHNASQPSQSVIAKVGAAVAAVEDEGLREALRTLGLALSSRPAQNGK